MRKIYTYYIKHIPTGKKYYGVKYGPDANPEILMKPGGYCTSSPHVHSLIEEYGIESFEVQVRKIFETAEEALAWETKVLTRLKAAQSDDWLNMHNGNGAKFKPPKEHSEQTKRKMRGRRGPRKIKFRTEQTRINLCKSVSKRLKGKVLTEQHKINISKASKGKKKPTGFGEKISKAISGENHPMWGKKHTQKAIEKNRQSNSGKKNGMFGRKHSAETLKKMREKAKQKDICVYCGVETTVSNIKRWHNDRCKNRA